MGWPAFLSCHACWGVAANSSAIHRSRPRNVRKLITWTRPWPNKCRWRNSHTTMTMLSRLKDFVRKRASDKFGETDAAFVMEHVFIALNYIHGRHLCHRNVNPDNMMPPRTKCGIANLGICSLISCLHSYSLGCFSWRNFDGTYSHV